MSPTRKILRVAVIGTRGLPSSYSGIEKACESLYTRLAERGHHITVYSRAGDSANVGDTYRGVRLCRMPAVKVKSAETLSHAAISLVHALVCGHFDVIHLHALAPGLLSVVRRVSALPVVVTIHGLDWQRAKWKGAGAKVLRFAERMIAAHANQIITVSRDLQCYFRYTYGRETAYIPNGVEPPAEADTQSVHHLKQFDLSPGEYFAYIGRLVPEKRIEDLISAHKALNTAHKLAIVGEGRYTNSYVRYLRHCAGTDPRVVFTGLLHGSVLEAVFRNATAFVLPSELEGLPMALLESMNYGVPAIASDIPPHRELLGTVSDYDLFFTPGDVSQLTERLRRIISSGNRYIGCAVKIREYARTAYSWSEIAAQTEKVLMRAARPSEQFPGSASVSWAAPHQ